MKKATKGSMSTKKKSGKVLACDQPIPYSLTLKGVVECQRKNVVEALQLYGDFPQLNAKTACSQDWQHVLTMRMVDLFEQLRFDESDPEVFRAIERELANIIATCEEWHAALSAQ
jgi:hypothetical protein